MEGDWAGTCGKQVISVRKSNTGQFMACISFLALLVQTPPLKMRGVFLSG